MHTLLCISCPSELECPDQRRDHPARRRLRSSRAVESDLEEEEVVEDMEVDGQQEAPQRRSGRSTRNSAAAAAAAAAAAPGAQLSGTDLAALEELRISCWSPQRLTLDYHASTPQSRVPFWLFLYFGDLCIAKDQMAG